MLLVFIQSLGTSSRLGDKTTDAMNDAFTRIYDLGQLTSSVCEGVNTWPTRNLFTFIKPCGKRTKTSHDH